MSVNIKYCILRGREPGSNCAASIASLIFVMHRVKWQMKKLHHFVFVAGLERLAFGLMVQCGVGCQLPTDQGGFELIEDMYLLFL